MAATTEHLEEFERRLIDQEKRVRTSVRAFGIFAALALAIALINLLAIVFKLNAKSTTTVATPAASNVAVRPAAPLPHRVGVTLRDGKLLPASTQAAGGRVSFAVSNSGTTTHEFVVIKTNKPAASLPVKGGKADETGNVGETGDLAVGQSKTINLKLGAGHYVFICNLPGHYQAGQHSDFTVK